MGSLHRRLAAALRAALPGAAALAALCPPAAAGPPTWEDLEGEGAVIEKLELRIADVFDLDDPGEDHFLGRLANFIHIDTKPPVVRRELLFDEGKPVEARLVRETERNLRGLRFIREARIEPLPGEEGKVTALVVTEDAWSLRGGFKFKYEGGRAEWGVDVEEVNFLGLGKTLRLAYEEDRERTTGKVGWRDPRFLGSRWRLAAEYADLSDGRRRLFSVGRPFFAFDTPRAAGASFVDEESDIRLYDLGEEAARYPAKISRVRAGLWMAFPRGRRSVFRAGLEYRGEDASYGEPVVAAGADLPEPDVEERDLKGLFLRGHFVEDRFVEAENLASIGRTEDLNVGWEILAAAGVYAEALGGGQDALAGDVEVLRHWRPGPATTLRFAGFGRGRYDEGRWRNSLFGASLLLFDQRLPRQTVAAVAALDGGASLAPESWLYLGSSDGLRGYPDEYLAGDRRWRLSVEDRVVTPWDIWGILRVGFVAFADAGAIRRLDSGRWSRVYADVGGGLRAGNLKSAFGRVVRATVAFPLVGDEGVSDFEIFLGSEIPF